MGPAFNDPSALSLGTQRLFPSLATFFGRKLLGAYAPAQLCAPEVHGCIAQKYSVLVPT